MKLLTKLTSINSLELIKKTDRWFIYADPEIKGNRFKVYSQSEINTSDQYITVISPQYAKANIEYPYSLIIKLFPAIKENLTSDLIVATLEREIYKSHFAFTYGPCVYNATFESNKRLYLVSYTFR